MRAAEVLIHNSNGELWIPRRTLHKRIAPGGLDYSMGCHVSAGETYIQAAIRELKEELNINIDPKHLKLIHKFTPIDNELAYFRCIYVLETDKVPNYNPDDFTGYEWLTAKELLRKLKAGERPNAASKKR